MYIHMLRSSSFFVNIITSFFCIYFLYVHVRTYVALGYILRTYMYMYVCNSHLSWAYTRQHVAGSLVENNMLLATMQEYNYVVTCALKFKVLILKFETTCCLEQRGFLLLATCCVDQADRHGRIGGTRGEFVLPIIIIVHQHHIFSSPPT